MYRTSAHRYAREPAPMPVGLTLSLQFHLVQNLVGRESEILRNALRRGGLRTLIGVADVAKALHGPLLGCTCDPTDVEPNTLVCQLVSKAGTQLAVRVLCR